MMQDTVGEGPYGALRRSAKAAIPARAGAKANDYTPDMAYLSRYVSSKWDSGVVDVEVGGKRHVLNFMAERQLFALK
jgi:hypothetical protein